MKARVERDALRKALKAVMPAVTHKATGAVSTGVLVETIAEDGLRLTATDLQLTIAKEVDAKVLDAGRLVVPARLLSNYVDRCPDGGVIFELVDGQLHVEASPSSNCTARFHLLSTDEWPKQKPLKGQRMTLNADQVDLVRRIVPFASTDEKRREITGVRFEGAAVTATDSYRMAQATVTGVDLPPATIPANALQIALQDAEEVEVTVDDYRAAIAHDACTWTSVLLAGKYPDARQFLRTSSPHGLTFSRAHLEGALSRCAVLDGDGKPTCIQRDGGKATIWIEQADTGRTDDVVPCDGDFEEVIGFNPAALTSLLTAAGTDDVTLEVVDSLKPVVIHAPNLALLTMPVRVAH